RRRASRDGNGTRRRPGQQGLRRRGQKAACGRRGGAAGRPVGHRGKADRRDLGRRAGRRPGRLTHDGPRRRPRPAPETASRVPGRKPGTCDRSERRREPRRMKWQEWLGRLVGGGRRGRITGWVLVAGLVGAAAMILNSYLTLKDADSIAGSREPPPAEEARAIGRSDPEPSEYEAFEARYEAAIRDILQKIAGVGEVDVMVTIDSTEELVVERHVEQRQQN